MKVPEFKLIPEFLITAKIINGDLDINFKGKKLILILFYFLIKGFQMRSCLKFVPVEQLISKSL